MAVPRIPDIPQRKLLSHLETAYRLRLQLKELDFNELPQEVVKQLVDIVQEEERAGRQAAAMAVLSEASNKSTLTRYNNPNKY